MRYKYKEGKLSFSKGAKRSGLTLWEFEQALIASGFTSRYATEDLQKEFALLTKRKSK